MYLFRVVPLIRVSRQLLEDSSWCLSVLFWTFNRKTEIWHSIAVFVICTRFFQQSQERHWGFICFLRPCVPVFVCLLRNWFALNGKRWKYPTARKITRKLIEARVPISEHFFPLILSCYQSVDTIIGSIYLNSQEIREIEISLNFFFL